MKKYFFIILVLCISFCACATKDKGYYSYRENGVLEEEFDMLLAPQMDYETEIPYEDQIKNTKPKTKGSVKLAKPPKQTTAEK